MGFSQEKRGEGVLMVGIFFMVPSLSHIQKGVQVGLMSDVYVKTNKILQKRFSDNFSKCVLNV